LDAGGRGGGPAILLLFSNVVKIYKTQYFRSFRDTLIDGLMLDIADKEIISPFSCDYSRWPARSL